MTIATLIAGGMLMLMIREEALFSCGVLLAVWTLMIGWFVGLTLINIFPTIWVGDEGLTISAFLFKRVTVPWADIVDIGAGRVRFGGTLIRARRITPFHRVYGWFYSRSWYPSFVIGRDIQHRDELLREIRQRAPVKPGR